MHATSLATMMSLMQTVDEKGRTVVPIKGAEARPFNYIQKRLNVKFGHYALMLLKVSVVFSLTTGDLVLTRALSFSPLQNRIPFEKVLQPSTLARLANLEIDDDTPLSRAKEILTKGWKESLQLDVDSDSAESSDDDSASTPRASGSGSRSNDKGKKSSTKASGKKREATNEAESSTATKKPKVKK